MAVSPAPPRDPGGRRNASNNPVPAIPQKTIHNSAFNTRGSIDREKTLWVCCRPVSPSICKFKHGPYPLGQRVNSHPEDSPMPRQDHGCIREPERSRQVAVTGP